MPSKKIKTPLEPGKVYHIYNRGNNHQKVFFKGSDFSLFLENLSKYLTDYCSIYAYVLIPNHYHLVLRVNDDLEVNELSNRFLKFSLSYTNKINFEESRNGSLFLSHFRRIHVDTEDYLRRLIFYLHHNPTKHEMIKDFKNYPHSSYKSLISDKPTRLARKNVLELFGTKEEFINYHQVLHNEAIIKKYLFDEGE
ncbi:transposase [Lentimicrobium sp. S6]|uniref:transposase n=1 Tax=Lentimicrobium sp. S6 TaxID=2735872 RepID=UPI0015521A9C|nr:transposase [Lentimicrobium sp. S6]NPD45734.1 transposase [Lentimicrobium sp. S6]